METWEWEVEEWEVYIKYTGPGGLCCIYLYVITNFLLVQCPRYSRKFLWGPNFIIVALSLSE